MVEQVEQDLQEFLLLEVFQDGRVLGEVANKLDHEADELVALVLVDWLREAVLDCRDLGLLDEVRVQEGLAGHVAQSDACGLDQVDFVLLC